MVDSLKIASTLTADLSPVGSQQERDFNRITDFISDELGPDVATLFAEPVSNRDGSRIDWYTTRHGRIEPLSEMPQEQAADLRNMLAGMERKIEDLAERLTATSQAGDRALGRALMNALTVPSDKHIYAVDGQPVLVAWGYGEGNKPGYRGGLAKVGPVKAAVTANQGPTVMAQAQVLQTEEPTTVATTGAVDKPRNLFERRWMPGLLWLLFLLLLIGIFSLLLRACALSAWMPWMNYCSSPVAGSSSARIVMLQQEIRLLENALDLKKRQCTAAAPRGGVNLGRNEGANIGQNEIEARLRERSAMEGSLQVSLVWSGRSDLDLSMKCGTGTIDYTKKTGCGGQLDIDSNDGRNATSSPVENIVWASQSNIPPGALPIFVTLFDYRGEPAHDVPYTIRVVRKQADRVISENLINGTIQKSQIKQTVQAGFANE